MPTLHFRFPVPDQRIKRFVRGAGRGSGLDLLHHLLFVLTAEFLFGAPTIGGGHGTVLNFIFHNACPFFVVISVSLQRPTNAGQEITVTLLVAGSMTGIVVSLFRGFLREDIKNGKSFLLFGSDIAR
jgi:hypothetical protein